MGATFRLNWLSVSVVDKLGLDQLVDSREYVGTGMDLLKQKRGRVFHLYCQVPLPMRVYWQGYQDTTLVIGCDYLSST